MEINKHKSAKSRLLRGAEILLAGRRQKQATVSVRLSGQAAQLWADLMAQGERLGLKPAELLALVLADSAAKAVRELKGLPDKGDSF